LFVSGSCRWNLTEISVIMPIGLNMSILMARDPVLIFAVQVLLSAGLMGATFCGSGYRLSEDSAFGVLGGFVSLLLCATGVFFFGWYWCLFWLLAYSLRLLLMRGRSVVYAPEPEKPDIDYGHFGDIAKRVSNRKKAEVPDDETLRDLLRRDKTEEARNHAREMMEVARSLGDEKRAAEYARWLGIAP